MRSYIRRVGRGQLLVLDSAVPVVVGAVVAVGVMSHAEPAHRPLALALGLASAAALTARRWAPAATLAAAGGLVLALLAVDPAAGATAVFAPAVALYSVGLTRGRVHQAVAAVAAVAAVVTADVYFGDRHAVTLQTLAHAALVAVPLLAAAALRNRRSYVALLLERLELAERTREDTARRLVEQERLRIARDLHDVVAHTLTTINVQAGVAAHLLDRAPGHARTALTTIEGASRDALDELRAVVGVLRERDGGGGAPLEPTPTLDAVSVLVERTRGAGQDVCLEIRGERPPRLPDAVQLAAFRIVQESLTNIRRHAAGAPAHVRLAFEPGRLLVAVDNGPGATTAGIGDGDGAGTGDRDGLGDGGARRDGLGDGGARRDGVGLGVGIVGMRERAAAVGGRLDAGPTGAGFRVAAELPYRRGA
jgi:signal transduction histidine kinase